MIFNAIVLQTKYTYLWVMNAKYILIGVCVVLMVVIGALIYRMGVISERKGNLEAEMIARKQKIETLLKTAENTAKQNSRLLKEINGLQCEIEVIEIRLAKRTKELNKIKKDVQTDINSYAVDTNRLRIFTELLK